MRFSGKSDVYMSTAYQRDTVHVEFALWKRTDTYNEASGSLAGYQTILQTMVGTTQLMQMQSETSCYTWKLINGARAQKQLIQRV